MRVNLSKSSMSPVGAIANAVDFASVLGCSIVPLPSTYLGLSLGASPLPRLFGTR